jgi:hypothetical protein
LIYTANFQELLKRITEVRKELGLDLELLNQENMNYYAEDRG